MNRAFYIFLLMVTSCFSSSSFAGRKKNDDDTDRRAHYTEPSRLKNEPRDARADETRNETRPEIQREKNERRNNQRQGVRSFWTPLDAIKVGGVLSFYTLEGTVVHPSQVIPYDQGYAGLVNIPNPERGYGKHTKDQIRVSWVISDEESANHVANDISSKLMRQLSEERSQVGQENACLVVAASLKFYTSSSYEDEEDQPQNNAMLTGDQWIEKNDEIFNPSLLATNKEEDALNPTTKKDARNPEKEKGALPPEKKEQKDDPSQNLDTKKEDPSSMPVETKKPEASNLVEKKQEAPLTQKEAQKVTRAKDKKK